MKLETYRRLHKISQAAIGLAVGVKAGTISRYESGEREPRLSMIRKITKATGGEVTAEDWAATAADYQPRGVEPARSAGE